MRHQTSSMPDQHAGQGKGWWRTLLKHGVIVLRSCLGLRKASMSPLVDLVGLHSSTPVSSQPYSVDEDAANSDNETTESVISLNDEEAAYDYEAGVSKKLTKEKYQAFSEGSTTDSSEDEQSTHDDQELKLAMLQSIYYERELEDWIRFRTPGATYHEGETSGVSTSYSHLSELELLEMIHF